MSLGMGGTSDPDEEKRREQGAKSLQDQIDEIVAGEDRGARGTSLRDFVDEKMAEDRRHRNCIIVIL